MWGYDYDTSITGDCSFYICDENESVIYPVQFLTKGFHYTFVFDTFVFMQVFNEINARKLGEFEYNVFEGFFNNMLFLFILIFTVGMQFLFVAVGGKAMRCAPLTW